EAALACDVEFFLAGKDVRRWRATNDLANPDRAAAATERSRDLMSALVDRRRLREEAFQDVIADGVVLLVERGMRDARHHGELLVGIGQPLEEFYEVGKARDAIVFAA